MIKITVPNRKTYYLSKKDNVQLKNEGTYGNGSIDWGVRGLYLYEIAEQIGVKNPVAAKIKKKVYPMDTFITQDCKINFIDVQSSDGQKILTRTGCFLLGYGVKKIFSSEIIRLGSNIKRLPIIHTDFILPSGKEVADIDLKMIEQKIIQILLSGKQIEAHILPYYDAVKRLNMMHEEYMIEKIEKNDDGGPVAVDVLDDYFDLHSGIQLPNLQLLKGINILDVENTVTRCRIYAELVLNHD